MSLQVDDILNGIREQGAQFSELEYVNLLSLLHRSRTGSEDLHRAQVAKLKEILHSAILDVWVKKGTIHDAMIDGSLANRVLLSMLTIVPFVRFALAFSLSPLYQTFRCIVFGVMLVVPYSFVPLK